MHSPYITLLLFLFITTIGRIHAQDVVFKTWKDYQLKRSDTINGLKKEIRGIKEIRRYGGNDYQFTSKGSDIDPKTYFAIKHQDSLYINGEKIKLEPYFCKVEYETDKKIFLYGTLIRNKKNQLQDAEGLFEVMGAEVNKLERGLNEKRILYMLNKKAKRATPIEVSYEMVKSYLDENKNLLKRYLKDDKRMLYNTMVRYIVEMDKTES